MASTAASKVVLDELKRLMDDAEMAEEEEARLAQLETQGVDQLRKKTRRKSREIETKIANLTDKSLESAFKQFDADGSETLDANEIKAACAAAGMPISDANVERAIKLLDANGDGVLDLKEFKKIALMGSKLGFTDKMYAGKVNYAMQYMAWEMELKRNAKAGKIEVDWAPKWSSGEEATAGA